VTHTQEVGLAGMLSLLTAVLLHATASGSPASSEPDYTALPHNFCAVAELVLRSALLCHSSSLPLKWAIRFAVLWAVLGACALYINPLRWGISRTAACCYAEQQQQQQHIEVLTKLHHAETSALIMALPSGASRTASCCSVKQLCIELPTYKPADICYTFLLMFATRQWTHSKDQVTWSSHQSARLLDQIAYTYATRLLKPY